jgi:mono/diheme cytochrome c family protein
MRQRLPGLVLAVAALPLAVCAQEPPSVEQGRRLYGSYCARCHGLNMVTPGAAFFDLRTLTPAEQERFERSVTQGLRAMPAWGSILQPGDVQALWLYVMAGK